MYVCIFFINQNWRNLQSSINFELRRHGQSAWWGNQIINVGVQVQNMIHNLKILLYYTNNFFMAYCKLPKVQCSYEYFISKILDVFVISSRIFLSGLHLQKKKKKSDIVDFVSLKSGCSLLLIQIHQKMKRNE
jgi:large-conductance mechanosensitive channel